MKKFIVEYIDIVGYVATGIIFGIAFFIILFNFYHAKEVSATFDKGDNYVNVYDENKSTLEKIKSNIAVFDANNYRDNNFQTDLIAIKSKIEMCINSFEKTKANEIFTKKEVSVLDVYNLLSYYQTDIVNDCITVQLYSLRGYNGRLNSTSFEIIKPYIDSNAELLSNDLDYVKRNLQNNSSFAFSSDYDKINVFNLARESYTRIETSYKNSISLLLNVSEWFRKYVGGEIQ